MACGTCSVLRVCFREKDGMWDLLSVACGILERRMACGTCSVLRVFLERRMACGTCSVLRVYFREKDGMWDLLSVACVF